VRVFAMCGASQEVAVKRASGVRPVLCPPESVLTVGLDLVFPRVPYDLMYFSLHGTPGDDCWYGEDWLPAIEARDFEGRDLSSTVVFVANCYFEFSVMAEAILDCHPKALIGGAGVNYTRGGKLVGTNLLGWYVRRLLAGGLDPVPALHLAKLGVKGKIAQIKNRWYMRKGDKEDLAANEDTLHFKIIKRKA